MEVVKLIAMNRFPNLRIRLQRKLKSGKKLLFFILFLNFVYPVSSQEFIPLWPKDKMPNTKGMKLEHIEERERITQVSIPGMYAFITSKEENSGSAVIIFPSGGYHKLTYNIGGFQLAKWFNTIGINAFVVLYRLPTSPDLVEKQFGPLQDAQRALKLVRANAGKWGIDTKRVGVFGSSAGGHLAANLCTVQKDYSLIEDSIDNVSFLPNFQILVSPVISLGNYTHKGSKKALLGENPTKELLQYFSNELNVHENTPECFLVHASNDTSVHPFNSVMYYQAFMDKGISASLHIFPEGGHSIALRNSPGSTNIWTDVCEAWLSHNKYLKN